MLCGNLSVPFSTFLGAVPFGGFWPYPRQVFELLGADPYWEFALQQLEVTVPAPSFSGYDQIGRVLQQAVTDVLTGEASPEEAAAAAFDAIPR